MRPRILVLDDNDELREMFRASLGARGFDVSVAATGAEALQIAATHRIDAVLSDLDLPGFSGLDFCWALRRQPFARHVPVWVMTGMDDGSVMDRATAAGADGVILKPFRIEDVCTMVRAALQRHSRSAGEPVPAAVPPARQLVTAAI